MTTPLAQVRAATPADLAFVYESLCELEETRLPFAPFERIYLSNLASPAVRYVIAEGGGRAAGFASCHVQPLLHHAGLVAEIQELYVRPAYRQQGLGQQLVAHFMALARLEGWVTLEVTSNRRRERTHVFYERLGFAWTSKKFCWTMPPPPAPRYVLTPPEGAGN